MLRWQLEAMLVRAKPGIAEQRVQRNTAGQRPFDLLRAEWLGPRLDPAAMRAAHANSGGGGGDGGESPRGSFDGTRADARDAQAPLPPTAAPSAFSRLSRAEGGGSAASPPRAAAPPPGFVPSPTRSRAGPLPRLPSLTSARTAPPSAALSATAPFPVLPPLGGAPPPQVLLRPIGSLPAPAAGPRALLRALSARAPAAPPPRLRALSEPGHPPPSAPPLHARAAAQQASAPPSLAELLRAAQWLDPGRTLVENFPRVVRRATALTGHARIEGRVPTLQMWAVAALRARLTASAQAAAAATGTAACSGAAGLSSSARALQAGARARSPERRQTPGTREGFEACTRSPLAPRAAHSSPAAALAAAAAPLRSSRPGLARALPPLAPPPAASDVGPLLSPSELQLAPAAGSEGSYAAGSDGGSGASEGVNSDTTSRPASHGSSPAGRWHSSASDTDTREAGLEPGLRVAWAAGCRGRRVCVRACQRFRPQARRARRLRLSMQYACAAWLACRTHCAWGLVWPWLRGGTPRACPQSCKREVHCRSITDPCIVYRVGLSQTRVSCIV
jgi:hypothetical protein